MDFRVVMRLLGKLAMAMAALMLIPLLYACIYENKEILSFIGSIFITLGVSFFLQFFGIESQRQRLRVREAAALMGTGWLLVCILGALPYIFGSELGLLGSIFESVSGFTTTGVTTLNDFFELPHSVLIWRCMTHWVGGIGVIMLFICIMPQVNSGTNYLFNAEMPGAVVEKTLPKIKESALLLISLYCGLTFLACLLFLLAGVPFTMALNASLATMATGGFSFYHDSLITFSSVAVEIIAVFFMLVASINFSLFYAVMRGDWTSLKNSAEVRYYLGLIIVAGFMVSSNLFYEEHMNLAQSFRHGYFQVVSIASTTGFASDDFDKWPSFSRYMLFVLMFIGGCGGSTAGGIKISRMVILLKAGWAELLRTLHPRIVYSIKFGDRVIEPEVVGNITRFFFLYIIVFISLTVIVSVDGLTMMDSMGLIAACMSSVGPAFGIAGPTSNYAALPDFARFIAILAMLLGRLEVFSLLVIMQPNFWRDKHNW